MNVTSENVVDITTGYVARHHDHPGISTGLWKYLVDIDTSLKPALSATNVLWNCLYALLLPNLFDPNVPLVKTNVLYLCLANFLVLKINIHTFFLSV